MKAASNVAPADQPVADKLRDMLGTKSLRYFDRKNERAAVEKFYSARDYAPQWTQAGKLTDSGKGVIARLKDAAADGLNPADYPVPDFAAATSPDQLAEAELKLTASMLDYARQAQSGRMHWSQVAADILYPEHPTDPAEVLANISTAKDASAALDSYNPPHKLYKDLKAKLAELRGQGDGPVIQIAEGPALAFKAATKKQGAVTPEDPRVPQLRAKLGIADTPTTRITTPRSPPPCANSRIAPISSRPACSTTARSRRSTARSATARSTRCSSTWNACAGCRASSARPRSATPMSSSTSPTSR